MKGGLLKKLFLFLFTALLSASTVQADQSLNSWDSEFNQAMNELETVKQPAPSQTAPANVPLDTLHNADQNVIDTREDQDVKARMVRMENKIAELERELKSSNDRIRNLDRQVNELKRKV